MGPRTVALLAALACAGSRGRARAEPPADPPVAEGARGIAGIALRLHGGVATAPFPAEAFPEARGQALVTVLSAYASLGRAASIGVRLPLVAATVRQPAGAYVDEAAWGNPEIDGEGIVVREPWAGATLRVVVGGAIGAPIAQYGPSGPLLQNRALAVGSAIEGWTDRELYTPGVLPISTGARAELVGSRYEFALDLKLPLLVRVLDADLAAASRRAVGLYPVIGARGAFWPWPWLGLSLGADAAFDLARVEEPARPTPRFQLVGAPRVTLRLHRSLRASVECFVPIGGALGGDTVGCGLGMALVYGVD
jgi:hypothetical protein